MASMESATICPSFLRETISALSFGKALTVLAEATSATVVLFDAVGDVVVGPITGNVLAARLAQSEQGRSLLVAAHRSAIHDQAIAAPSVDAAALIESMDHFALPLTIGDRRAGTLTLGDRPRHLLSPAVVERLAHAAGLPPTALASAASQLRPWSAGEAFAARNLTSLLGELFTELCARDKDLQHRIEELSAVYNIGGLVAGSLDLNDALGKVAALICTVMRVKACSIRLLDEQTGGLAIKAVHNLSPEYLGKGPVTVDDNPIDASALRGEIVRISDAPNDPRTRYPQQARKEGIVSGLVCGMVYRGEAVGVLRVYTGEAHVFTPFEESLLQAVASQVAAAILTSRLFAEALEAERYARQLAYAGEVQRRMIPERAPSYEGLDIGAIYRPTFEVGGDFYDFISLPGNNLGLAIADVSGKGVPASLQMASLRAALRVNAYHMYDIDRILSEVNRHLCRDTLVGEFATAFYGVLNPGTGRLTYCNAGHHPPMLLRGGEIQELLTGGTVLGMDPDAAFDRGIVDLRAGDVLLLYTDGAVEALNFADEQFGNARLTESLRRHSEHNAQLIAQNLLWDIRRFRGLADRTDDLTMVVVKVGEKAAG